MINGPKAGQASAHNLHVTAISGIAQTSLAAQVLPARNGHEKGGRPHALPPLAERLLEEIPCVVRLLLTPARLTTNSGDAVVVNPEISSGLPIQGVNRWPPPASRPERYNTPATKGA